MDEVRDFVKNIARLAVSEAWQDDGPLLFNELMRWLDYFPINLHHDFQRGCSCTKSIGDSIDKDRAKRLGILYIAKHSVKALRNLHEQA